MKIEETDVKLTNFASSHEKFNIWPWPKTSKITKTQRNLNKRTQENGTDTEKRDLRSLSYDSRATIVLIEGENRMTDGFLAAAPQYRTPISRVRIVVK